MLLANALFSTHKFVRLLHLICLLLVTISSHTSSFGLLSLFLLAVVFLALFLALLLWVCRHVSEDGGATGPCDRT